jgi:hypothetical protein
MIPEGYEESLADALGFELTLSLDDTESWLLEVDSLEFNLDLGYITSAKLNKSELRPFARLSSALISWDDITEVDGEMFIELASSKTWPFGLRIRNGENEEVTLFLEHFTFLTLSLEQDADSLKTFIKMMAISASSFQEKYL